MRNKVWIMGIDTSAKWWIGSEPENLKEYLEAYASVRIYGILQDSVFMHIPLLG